MVQDSRIRFGLAIGIALLMSGPGRATQLAPLSEAELVARSSLIVIGRCTEVRSTWMGRRLMTLATVGVREVLKGEPRTRVTVVIPGGMDAQRPVPVAAVVADAPQLAPAEEVVLFLSNRSDEPDRYAVTGWAQGKVSILSDGKGGEMVAIDRRLPRPIEGASRPTPPGHAAGALPLAHFRTRILERVRSGSSQP